MNKDELIQQVIQKEIANKEEAEKEYERFTEEAKKQFSFLSPEQQEERTQIMFTNYFKALSKSNLKTFEGVILKSSGKEFITKRRIEKIMREYNENPEQAIQDSKIQLKNGQPVAVDNTKYFNAGKPNQRENPNYGKELDENNVQKIVEGIVMFDGEEKKFILTLRGDIVYKLKVPLLKPVRMKLAMGQSADADTLRLYAQRNSKFDILTERKIDVIKMVEKYYISQQLNISDIEEAVKQAGKQSYNLIKLIKGQVLELNLSPKADGTGGFRLMEEKVGFEGKINDCRVKIPEEWLEEIEFGEFSTVYVLGTPWAFKPQGQDNMVIGITANGIYPIVKVKPEQEANGIDKTDMNGNGEVKGNEEFNDFNKIDDKMFDK